MAYEFTQAYGWDIRPQIPERPQWFRSWPGGARLAIPILVLHEWESVPRHRSRPMPANAHYKSDFLALGAREYGARHGIWRLLDVLGRRGITGTVVTSGLVAELFPDSVRAAADGGHEVASHQWDQSMFPPEFESREQEHQSLARSLEALERATGRKPAGYMSPGPRPTPHTMDICAELGLVWTCDFNDSDIPYLIEVGGKRIVSTGYVYPGYTDSDILPLGLDGALRQLKAQFDAIYQEAAEKPMKLCYAAHVHWGASPGMGRVLDQFIAYAQGHEGVWFPRCIDIAEFWLKEGNQA